MEPISQYLFDERYKGRDDRICKYQIESYVGLLFDLLHPQLWTEHLSTARHVDDEVQKSKATFRHILTCVQTSLGIQLDPDHIVTRFYEALVSVVEDLNKDADYIVEGDPATVSLDEVVIAYPGYMALGYYRMAHVLYLLNVPIVPRVITEAAHRKTGIDIHPGAKISAPCYIDHGTGIVVGETTVIGPKVKLYQGVTLGALSVDKGRRGTKRHPTIRSGVILYSNATVLGGETEIGENSTIGGNVFITKSVPADTRVFAVSSQQSRS